MIWFAVYKKTTGRLISTGQVVAPDSVLIAAGAAKLTLAFNPQVPEKQWNEITRQFDDVVPPKPRLSAREFLERLTETEREDIFDAAKTSKKLHAFIETVKVSDMFDPNDPRTIAALNRIETAGLIGPGRAAEVFT